MNIGEILASALVALGISASTAAFAVKWIADRVTQAIEYKYSKELEKIRSKNERKRYVSEKRFDTEFDMYQNLFRLLYPYNNATYMLYPTFDSHLEEEARKAIFEQRLKEFEQKHNEFLEILEQCAAFIPAKIYAEFRTYIDQAYALGIDYNDLRIAPDPRFRQDNSKQLHENFQASRKLKPQYEKIQNMVREYLESLAIE